MTMSATTSKFTQTLSLYFVLTWTLVSSDIYKSVMWTTNNPYFQNHNKTDNNLKSFCYGGDLEMNVNLKDVLPIICPFENLIMQTMESQPSSGVLYENLWIVYDKESYETCNVNLTAEFGGGGQKLKNKRLYSCDTPDALTNYFYRIDFKEDSPVSKNFYFEANTTYYFLATSDGGQPSLSQTSGGHCNNDGDNEIRMKFRVYVCGTNEQQKYIDPKCKDPSTIGTFRCVRPESPTPKPTTTSRILSSSISPSPTISTSAVSSSVYNRESSLCSCPSISYRWVTSTVVVNITGTGNCSITLTPSSTNSSINASVTPSIKTLRSNNLNSAGGNDNESIQPPGGPAERKTGGDASLLKSRDNWMLAAFLFIFLFIVAMIIIIIICYRIKNKCYVPCIYTKQIGESEPPSPQNTSISSRKENLHLLSFENVAQDSIDGKKTTMPNDKLQTDPNQMKQEPPLVHNQNGSVNTDIGISGDKKHASDTSIVTNGLIQNDTNEKMKTPSKLPPIETTQSKNPQQNKAANQMMPQKGEKVPVKPTSQLPPIETVQAKNPQQRKDITTNQTNPHNGEFLV